MNLIVILVALLVFAAAITAMAVGVMAGRKPIAGSCGGMANLRESGVAGLDGPVCEVCGAKPGDDCAREE